MPESRPATTSEVGFAGSCWGEGLRRCPGLCFPGTEWKGAYGVLFGEGAVAAEAIFLYFRFKKTEAVCGKGLRWGLYYVRVDLWCSGLNNTFRVSF